MDFATASSLFKSDCAAFARSEAICRDVMIADCQAFTCETVTIRWLKSLRLVEDKRATRIWGAPAL